MSAPDLGLPDLGLLVAPGVPEPLRHVLGHVRPWCVPRVVDPRHESAPAWLATAWRAPFLDRALASGRPVAVWAAGPADVDAITALAGHAAARRAAGSAVPEPIVVTDDPDLAELHGVMHVTGDVLDVAAFPPVTPFVRSRWRRAAGLPQTFVVVVDDAGGDGPSSVPYDLVPTALALASAAVVCGPRLAEAMAWATPCVTDAASAAALGAVDGSEVAIGGDRAGRREAAHLLAADVRRAASLGRGGRRLVERRDTAGAARRLARRLGLAVEPVTAAERISALLDEWYTPAQATIRLRALEATAALDRAAS